MYSKTEVYAGDQNVTEITIQDDTVDHHEGLFTFIFLGLALSAFCWVYFSTLFSSYFHPDTKTKDTLKMETL
jgi:hypothetical protein